MGTKPKVIIGLSGGVDSSVGVIKLLELGYDVEAIFMRNWDSAVNNDVLGNPDLMDEVCPQEKDYQDAKAVADKLGIKLHRVDFIEEYWNEVFTYFLDEYKKIEHLILISCVIKKLNLNVFSKKPKQWELTILLWGIMLELSMMVTNIIY